MPTPTLRNRVGVSFLGLFRRRLLRGRRQCLRLQILILSAMIWPMAILVCLAFNDPSALRSVRCAN
uniref:Uncharacterized protein n=1 Tax=Setaria italica TaxID=4555 RepID=K3ZGD8_SETIT